MDIRSLFLCLICVPLAGCVSTLDAARSHQSLSQRLTAVESAIQASPCLGVALLSMDLDGDGRASLKEFTDFANRAADELFRRADLNTDGFLSRDEFIEHRKANVQQFLLALDINGDGLVRRDELIRSGLANKLQQLVLAMDADGNGVVTGDEFRDFHARLYAQFLTEQDSNRDGRIGRKEFLDYNLKLFREADHNQDGFLDRNEYRAKAVALRTLNDALLARAAGPRPRGWENRYRFAWGFLCPAAPEMGPLCPPLVEFGPGGGAFPPDRGSCDCDPWSPGFDPWAPCCSCFPFC